MRITKKTKFLPSDQVFECFSQLIKESGRGKRVKKDGKRIRSSTIDNYVYTRKLLQEFAIENNYDLKIYIANHLSRKETEQAKKYYKKFFKDFTDYLYFKKDFYDNYVGMIVKTLRVFFNYLNSEMNLNIGDFHKSFYIPSEEIPIIVFSPEQLNYLIYNKELEEKLPTHLKKAKDVFVFGCTVALRFSDLMQLKPGNLQFYNGNYYIKVNSIKTDTHTTIKLPDYAVDILKKYHKKQKTLIPAHSKNWYNKCFKELGRNLEFKTPEIKYRTKRGIKYPIYKNKERRQHYTLADHITTHTMRRTAITTMLRLGMPEQVVRKISGHAANSKEFFRYVEFAQGYVDQHTDKVFEQISNIEVKNSLFS
jgi:integrase